MRVCVMTPLAMQVTWYEDDEHKVLAEPRMVSRAAVTACAACS